MRKHLRRFVLSLVGVAMQACSPTQPVSQPSAPQADMARGLRLYSTYCQSCHDTGNNGAPRLDDADQWDDRSLEWTTLMGEHVGSGFLDMPAKGGQNHLSERDIQAVLYYMIIMIESKRY